MKELKNNVKRLMGEEMERANEKFPLFASDHEGYAVILEEWEEVIEELEMAEHWSKEAWKFTKENKSNLSNESIKRMRNRLMAAAAEAIQAAAMCEKFIQSQEARE